MPAAALLSVAGAGMLYYNWRVTGDTLLLPYTANRRQYAVAGVFSWQKPAPVPEYRHQVMRDFYTGWELAGFNLSRGWQGFEAVQYEKLFKLWLFFLGPVFTIALFPLWRVIRDKRIRMLLIVAAISGVIMTVSVWAAAHYFGPYTALIYLVMLQGLRHVRTWKIHGKPTGIALMRALVVICVVMLGLRAAAGPLHLQLVADFPSWGAKIKPDYHREDVIAGLKRQGGRHLVIVRYTPDHTPDQEWVYNDADIDAATVVWAREMDPARNARLLEYFHDRRVWLLEPDKDLQKLENYPR